MKLTHLYESNILDDMMEWGAVNIYDFSRLKLHGVIEINEKTGTFNAFGMVINTQVEEFPFAIEVENTLKITAPNLKSFKNIKNINVPTVIFTNQSKLNFYDLDSTDIHGNNVPLSFGFGKYNHLEADMFTKHKFNALSFNHCPSSTLYDFSQYLNNAGIVRLYFLGIFINDIKNLTYLLDTSVLISNVIFSGNVALQKIVNTYLQLPNKSDYVMDMTIELLDNDFEENIL